MMGVEKLSQDSNEHIEKGELKDLLMLKNKFLNITDGISRREDEKKKTIEFGRNVYKDGPERIHVPFDAEMRIVNEYNQKFKGIDVSMLGVIKPSKYRNGSVIFQIFESGENGRLIKKNLLLDSSISNYGSSVEEKVSIELKKNGLTKKQSHSMIKKAIDYLSMYFGYEELKKAEAKVDEIQFREMKSVLEEGDPEELIEQMDWSVGI